MFKSFLIPVALLTVGIFLATAQEQSTGSTKTTAATTERRSVETKPGATLSGPPRRGIKGKADATPTSATPPAPEKRGFFQRLFGRRTKRVPQATPPPATPRPVNPRPRKPHSARSNAEPTTDDTERKPETKSTDKSATGQPGEGETKGAAVKPGEPAATSPAVVPKKKAGQRATGAKTTPPPDLTTPEAQEKWKYAETRKKALEDEDVRKLKEKADTAPNDEEGRRALRAYNKALFNKMRTLEPSIKDRIDAMEAGVMKRLGE